MLPIRVKGGPVWRGGGDSGQVRGGLLLGGEEWMGAPLIITREEWDIAQVLPLPPA